MTSTSLPAVARRLAASLCCLTLLGLQIDALAAAAKPASGGPSFSRKVQGIFDANCVACHQSAGASGGLNLEDGLAYKSIVSRKGAGRDLVYVMPGNAQASYLLRKLEGTHVRAGGAGEQMPPTGPLDSASIAIIQEWIEAGAKNN